MNGAPVPNSSGTAKPRLTGFELACDSHLHVYDPRFPASGPAKRAATQATAADYRLLQKRLGTARAVVVTPAVYATDNRVTLDAIAQLGPQALGVAVIHPEATDAELGRLARGGIRGVRFTVFDPETAVTRIDMIEPVSRRVAELGWHVQLHMRADQIAENADLLRRLPSQVVFDHMGRLPQPAGTDHEAFRIVCELLGEGRAWVKLSGAYLDSRAGPPAYADATRVAKAYVEIAPDRMLWGSDWPHPSERAAKPDDALLFDLLAEWAPDEAVRKRILVDNPAELYGFSASP
jgi:predicted TIM-barrel fold metal-dependent hydrolase